MGLTAMVVGSVSGFGMQMMNNALQKVPLSRSELSCVFFCSVGEDDGGFVGDVYEIGTVPFPPVFLSPIFFLLYLGENCRDKRMSRYRCFLFILPDNS